jgi:hypothetical protein
VYCGSSTQSNEIYNAECAELGRRLAQNGITVVYGGARIGIMGLVADTAMKEGGKVIGIIPHFIAEFEIAHSGLSEQHYVDTMHQRKQMMVDKSDVFIIAPGGIGTMDEMFEIITWKYLRLYDKPVIIANFQGYWNKLIELLDHMQDAGFMREPHRLTYTVANTVDEVMELMKR